MSCLLLQRRRELRVRNVKLLVQISDTLLGFQSHLTIFFLIIKLSLFSPSSHPGFVDKNERCLCCPISRTLCWYLIFPFSLLYLSSSIFFSFPQFQLIIFIHSLAIPSAHRNQANSANKYKENKISIITKTMIHVVFTKKTVYRQIQDFLKLSHNMLLKNCHTGSKCSWWRHNSSKRDVRHK